MCTKVAATYTWCWSSCQAASFSIGSSRRFSKNTNSVNSIGFKGHRWFILSQEHYSETEAAQTFVQVRFQTPKACAMIPPDPGRVPPLYGDRAPPSHAPVPCCPRVRGRHSISPSPRMNPSPRAGDGYRHAVHARMSAVPPGQAMGAIEYLHSSFSESV